MSFKPAPSKQTKEAIFSCKYECINHTSICFNDTVVNNDTFI